MIEKYCAFMPVPIYLENEKAEPQYETIEKDELTDKDTIVETVVEPAKTEEKEKRGRHQGDRGGGAGQGEV